MAMSSRACACAGVAGVEVLTLVMICNKVARDMGEFVHGPRRLLYPLRRIGPKGSEQFERISWDSALDEIHERVSDIIGRWGPEAVMPLNYAGPHGFLAGDSMSSRFFNRLGATHAEESDPRWRDRLVPCGVPRTGVLVKTVDDRDRE